MDTGYGLRGRGELFFVDRRDVAEAGMQALAVVPALNGPEQGRARRLPGVERTVAVQFRLEAAEEAFHGRVVPAVPLAAHRAPHPMLVQHAAVGVRTILGGFTWSSQHPDAGDCDGWSRAAFGPIWAGTISVARPSAGCGTG